MKITGIIGSVCFLLLGCFAGCDNYVRKGIVTPDITVNEHSLSLFVGEKIQLTASPSELSFTWKSEDATVATVDNKGLVTATGDGTTNIVVSSAGEMECRIPVTSVTRIPMKDFNLGESNIVIFANERRQFIPALTPSNANDAEYPVWRSLDNTIVTVDYKGEVAGVAIGSASVECKIKDIVKTITVDVVASKPFRSHVFTKDAPLQIKFIDFDFGGEGNAYHDNDSGNSGGNNYRAANGDNLGGGVDIGGDLAVGWTGTGEWLKYTVEVKDAGDYYISLDLAGANTSNIRFEIDGVNATGTIFIPSTGGWGNWVWQDVEKPVSLTEGIHILRFYLEAAGSNFRTMKFTPAALMVDPVVEVSNILTGTSGKTWKLGPWTGMRDPNDRNSVWWDFKDPAIMDDSFTFKPGGAFTHVNNGNSMMNESLGSLFPDGNTAGSFTTVHYTPPADATWSVSKNGGNLILTLKKGFLGYASDPNDLVQTQYSVSSYSNQSIRLIATTYNAWCYELVPF